MSNSVSASELPGLVQRMTFSDFEVCWAGPDPFSSGLCFGSLNGEMLFTDESGNVVARLNEASAAHEAINAVAGSAGWLAVTTRAEVNFISPADANGVRETVVFPAGAHGVAVAPSGQFVAALGRAGILFVKPGSRQEDPVTISGADSEGLYVYHVHPLRGVNGEDLVVFAGRRGGFGATTFREDQETPESNVVCLENLDVVDVCPIGTGRFPLAVVATARDGTLIFVRNVLRDEQSQSLKFEGIVGTAYRLLSAFGDLFLLTSKALYILRDLAETFVNATPATRFSTLVRTLAMEAVDANLAGDKWLLVTMTDEVLRFDVQALRQTAFSNSGPDEAQGIQPKNVRPQWAGQGITQKSSSFPLVTQ